MSPVIPSSAGFTTNMR